MSDNVLTRSSVAPPTAVTAALRGDVVVISWSKPATALLGYNIYQNGEKVAFIPQIAPLFEFPFSNESLSEKMLMCSEISELIYETKLQPFVSTRFDISSVSADGESELVGITVIYQRYFEFTNASINPNPVDTGRQFLISASVRDEHNLIIS